MKVSEYFLPTLRKAPADATLKSHELMLRAGLIQKVGSGLYNYLPLGFRVFKKVEAIIREEMDASGALEAVMPILVPQELLLKSGRWNAFKEELFRLQDRNEATFALCPTNEENFTQTLLESVQSYKNLPINLYQIEKKFRDEIRPRYGVMRGKQFTMKDAYSFHLDSSCLEQTYGVMRETYKRIFTRLDFDFVHVKASSGAMGGSHSEEFIVKSQVGEEDIIICEKCTYAANIETASETLVFPDAKSISSSALLETVATPGADTIEKVCKLLKLDKKFSIKTLLYEVAHEETSETYEPVIVIIRGDYEVSETKLEKAFAGRDFKLASEKTILEVFNCEKGYLAPIQLPKPVSVLVDVSLSGLTEGVAGANKKDTHFLHVDLERDIKQPLLKAGSEFYREVELYQAREGGSCSQCQHPLKILKGIEVGHIFALGDRYSKAFKLSVLNKQGKPATPLMGCYGIGVDRCLAAVVETHHDDNGIVFPFSIAPFTVMIISLTASQKSSPVSGNSRPVLTASEELYHKLLEKGIEVLWDERSERAGIKFKDADLIGIPIQVIISDTLLNPANHEKEMCELKLRKEGTRQTVPLAEAVSEIEKLIPSPSRNL